jgi:hypothetical protein
VVGSYVTFCYVVGGRQLCYFLVGGWWESVMGLSDRGLVVGSYVPFR